MPQLFSIQPRRDQQVDEHIFWLYRGDGQTVQTVIFMTSFFSVGTTRMRWSVLNPTAPRPPEATLSAEQMDR